MTDFSIKLGSPEKQHTGCVVVGVYETGVLSAAADLLDRLSNGFIRTVVARGDLDGKAGTSLMLHAVPHTVCDRVLLVGLGKQDEFNDKNYRKALTAAAEALSKTPTREAVSTLAELPVPARSLGWKMETAAWHSLDARYQFRAHKTKPDESNLSKLDKLAFAVSQQADVAEAEIGLMQGLAIGRGMALAKDLGNAPSNVCTPSYLADTARSIAQQYGTQVEVLEREDMAALGMHSLLSVAKGSIEPPKLIVLTYTGASAGQKPVVLVGKGVTFDSGGISLKPGEGMDEMKYDMCGAASVLGTFQAVAEMKLPINLIALVPTVENMPAGNASKPGDIVTSLSGQTIEILNTDAEGRLILCDALTYAERFEPAAVVDVATLTGACIIALGHQGSGLFSNQDPLAEALLAAGKDSGDRAWQLPLWEEYQEQLKSNFADMANIGGRPAGSITAACFLSRFTKAYAWAHLDIAGVAWKSGKEKGATGRPVPLLTRFLQNRAQADAAD